MSIEGRILDIEMDVIEGNKALSAIAKDNGFANTGALRDFLCSHDQQALWSKAQLTLPANETPGARIREAARVERTRPPEPPPATPERGLTPPEVQTSEPFGVKLARYIIKAQESPKKRTVAKADRLLEKAHELIALVDAEAEAVEALEEIKALEQQLAEARAKLRGPRVANDAQPSERPPAAVVRAWAKEHFEEHVPDAGKLSQEIYDAYAEAHRS
jgi:hypothetical protein